MRIWKFVLSGVAVLMEVGTGVEWVKRISDLMVCKINLWKKKSGLKSQVLFLKKKKSVLEAFCDFWIIGIFSWFSWSREKLLTDYIPLTQNYILPVMIEKIIIKSKNVGTDFRIYIYTWI